MPNLRQKSVGHSLALDLSRMWDFSLCFLQQQDQELTCSWFCMVRLGEPSSCQEMSLVSSIFPSPWFLGRVRCTHRQASGLCVCNMTVIVCIQEMQGWLAKWTSTACCCAWSDDWKIPFLPCTLKECVLLSSARYIPQHNVAGCCLCIGHAVSQPCSPVHSSLPGVSRLLRRSGGACASQEWKAVLCLPWGTNLLSLCEAEQKSWGPTAVGIPEYLQDEGGVWV